MNAGEVIKTAMKAKGMTQTQMAKLLNKTQSVIATRLNNGNISADVMCEMLDLLGYELVVQPKKRGKRADGQIVINQGE